MAKIKLDPSILLEQSVEMETLGKEYDVLFSGVTSILNQTNNNWSANLAHNFSGKITTAQKGFAGVVDMLNYGASAAKTSAESFQSIDLQMEKAIGEKISASGKTGVARINSSQSEPSLQEVSGLSTPFYFSDFEDPIYKVLKEIYSGMGKVEDYSEILESLNSGFLKDFMSEVHELAEEFKDTLKEDKVFQILGYIYDGLDTIKAWTGGDVDKVESLAEKYIKKGIKAGTKEFIGVAGNTKSVYIDLAWNFGKNAVEGIQQMNENPSIGSLASLVWDMTGKTFVDTGVNMASEGIEFVYGLLGKEFDKEDFEECMDFLGKVTMESLASFVENPVQKIGTTVNIMTEAAGSAVEAVWKGIVNIGESVGSWFSSTIFN